MNKDNERIALKFYNRYGDKLAYDIKFKCHIAGSDCIQDIKQLIYIQSLYLVNKYKKGNGVPLTNYILKFIKPLVIKKYLSCYHPCMARIPEYKLWSKSTEWAKSYKSLDTSYSDGDKSKEDIELDKKILEGLLNYNPVKILDANIDCKRLKSNIYKYLRKVDKAYHSKLTHTFDFVYKGGTPLEYSKKYGVSRQLINEKMRRIKRRIIELDCVKEFRKDYF